MARRTRRQMASSGSLDSFLDIVTNSLGLLILVALLSAFSTQGAKISLGTPIMTDAPEGLEVNSFEIRGGRIVPIDFEPFDSDLRAFFSRSYAEQIAFAEQYNPRGVTNGFHRLELHPGEAGPLGIGGSYALIPQEGVKGDTVEDLLDPGSDLGRRLAQLDHQKQWLFFFVRSDSFEQLREVRRIVSELGFQVGWTPVRLEDILRFGPGGRSPRAG